MGAGPASSGGFRIEPVTPSDAERLAEGLLAAMGYHLVARQGRLTDARRLPGFFAVDDDGRVIGVATYEIRDGQCEVVTLGAVVEGRGAGTALLAAVAEAAAAAGCRRAWLITTNDNVNAIGFYQRRGWDWCGFHRRAVDESRRTLKPEIPERDPTGIPISHELEFELRLDPDASPARRPPAR
jgi:N-acetylglutamate synthase-like GNAT family acetyltransferase